VAGALHFEDATVGCAGCHSGPRYSDDVRTGGPFVTATLLGIGRRGASMHDGCGQTLDARFDPDLAGDDHGRTGHLTSDALGELTADLSTL